MKQPRVTKYIILKQMDVIQGKKSFSVEFFINKIIMKVLLQQTSDQLKKLLMTFLYFIFSTPTLVSNTLHILVHFSSRFNNTCSSRQHN